MAGDIIGPREVDSILNSATRLTTIIERFLEMGHLESKEFALHQELCHGVISSAEQLRMLI